MDNEIDTTDLCETCNKPMNRNGQNGYHADCIITNIRVFVETTDPRPSYHKDVTITREIYAALKAAGFEKGVSVHYEGDMPTAKCVYCKREAIDNGTLAFYEPAETSLTGEARYYCGCRGWS